MTEGKYPDDQQTADGNKKSKEYKTKDRTKHEKQRGKKLRTLADLSRELPTEEEIANYDKLIRKESDRGSAIMAAAFVELALTACIRSRLVDPGDAITNAWFEGPSAPFSNFASKITLGRALGIYADNMENRLKIIKDIRNAFAHASRPLDFKEPTIESYVSKLNISPEKYKDRKDRTVFWSACLALGRVLTLNAIQHGGKEVVTDFE